MSWRHMGEWKYSSTFLLGTRWRWVVSFTPLLLYLRGRAPGTDWIGGWIDRIVGLDAVEKRKILHCRALNPVRPARSLSLYRLRYPDPIMSMFNCNIDVKSLVCPVNIFILYWIEFWRKYLHFIGIYLNNVLLYLDRPFG
jgi:hypothetical protein